MKYKILTALNIFLTVTIIGCDYKFDKPQVRPDIDAYLIEFEANTGIDTSNVIFSFALLNQHHATCLEPGDAKIILINKRTWNDLCDAQRRALVFHELGHCVLGLAHVDLETYGISYMLPTLSTCDFYEFNQEALDEDFFN